MLVPTSISIVFVRLGSCPLAFRFFDVFSPQVLEMIAPPYSTEFVQLFLPIVRNEEITGRLRNADHTDDVSLFLGERWF